MSMHSKRSVKLFVEQLEERRVPAYLVYAPQAFTVRGHKSPESPLLAQHFAEKPVVDVRRNSVDLVI